MSIAELAAAAHEWGWPTNPVRQFQLIFCLWIAVGMMRNMNKHVRFYKWFAGCGLTLASKRGLGAHPSKIFRLFTPPVLTAMQLRLSGIAFTACLLVSCLPLAPRVFLVLAAILYFLYFTQLFAECTLSGHGTILLPSILFLLSCAPSLDRELTSDSTWPLHLIRFFIASGYFSSGMCKLLGGMRFGVFWGRGPTIQMYIYDSMWSRPAGATFRAVQKWLLTHPRVATLFATGALFFEAGFVFAPFHAWVGLLFGVAGLGFHGGVLALQARAAAAHSGQEQQQQQQQQTAAAPAPAAAPRRRTHLRSEDGFLESKNPDLCLTTPSRP